MPTKLSGQTGNASAFGALRAFMLAVQPACWKLYGNALDLGVAQAIMQYSPDTFLVGREVRGQQFAPEDTDPIGTANRYADLVIARAAQFGNLIKAWESVNEPVINIAKPDGTFDLAASIQAAQRLNLFQLTFSRRLHAVGLKVIAYNLARGNPEYVLVPYLADGAEASDYLGLHAYFAPRYSDDPFNQALRYRRIYNLLPVAARRPIIFTEYGTDFNGGGFRLEANHMTVDDFLISCKAFDNALLADDYVAAACGFVFGPDSARWETFAMESADILPQLTELMKGSVPVTSATTPIDPPTPPTEPSAAEIMTVGWNSIGRGLDKTGVAVNTTAALYKAVAAVAPDAYPTGNETDFHGGTWVAQGYSACIVACNKSDFAHVKLYKWSTGEPWTAPAPPNPNPGPGPNPPRLTTIPPQPLGDGSTEMVNTGFKVESYRPAAGEEFYGLIQCDNFKFGVGTEVVVTVRDSVTTLGGIPVTQAFDPTRIKGPTVKTDGAGQRRVSMGPGDDFTPPQPPPDRIYVSLGDGVDGVKFPTVKGDVLVCGQVGGHTSWQMTFQKMVG